MGDIDFVLTNLNEPGPLVSGLLKIVETPWLPVPLILGGLGWLWWVSRDPKDQEMPDDESSGPHISGDITLTNSVNLGNVGHTINMAPVPRTLQGINVAPMVAQLSRYRGTQIELLSLANDPEGLDLAQDIRQLVEHAGWVVTDQTVAMWGGSLVGVVMFHPDADMPPSLAALGACLREQNIAAGGLVRPNQPALLVAVGTNDRSQRR